MLQQTAQRAVRLAEASQLITVFQQRHQSIALSQLANIDEKLTDHAIAEPKPRNTAAAIAIAAHYAIENFGEDTVLAVLPADHYIADEALWEQVLRQAANMAIEGSHLVTFGIAPTAPDSNYGYILRAISGEAQGTYPVERFIEKPEKVLAADLIETGRCYWNSGMFVFAASAVLEALQRYAPEIANPCAAAFATGGEQKGVFTFDADAYAAIPELPIDKAVMERADNVLIQPFACGWSDVGSWQRLAELAKTVTLPKAVLNALSKQQAA